MKGEAARRGRRRWSGTVAVATLAAGGLVCSTPPARPGSLAPAACVAAVRNEPLPAFRLVVRPRSDLIYTRVETRPPEIVVGGRAFVRRGWGCHAVVHEIGHAFDEMLMTPATRRRFAVEFLHDPRPWFAPDQDSPVEAFAEIYYLCATGSPVSRAAASAELNLTPVRLAGACAYIAGVGAGSRRAQAPQRATGALAAPVGSGPPVGTPEWVSAPLADLPRVGVLRTSREDARVHPR